MRLIEAREEKEHAQAQSNGGRLAGFFAWDDRGGIYLMHDGRLSGKGREKFLNWSDARLEQVADAQGRTRSGIVVAKIDSDAAADGVEGFVQTVLNFKNRSANRRGKSKI
jgi:hypothetical protein